MTQISQKTLAHRINLVLDAMRAETGEQYEYPDVAAGVRDHGGPPLSRQRWAYMRRSDGHMVQRDLLTALAAFFGVPAEYLTDEHSGTPDRVTAQLELLKAMREHRVAQFAARTLGGISPDKLDAIRCILTDRPDSPRHDEP